MRSTETIFAESKGRCLGWRNLIPRIDRQTLVVAGKESPVADTPVAFAFYRLPHNRVKPDWGAHVSDGGG